MPEYVIPAAFMVDAPTEADAARLLVKRLAAAELVDGMDGAISCWWTPNHPYADGSDTGDPRLVWTKGNPDD